MSPERWREVERLFHLAADRDPVGRQSVLENTDPELRAEVEKLLAGDSNSDSILDGALAFGQSLQGPPPGQRFGPYRIIGVIGHGGMGAVYRGVRDDHAFDKQVAIKVLHLGSESPEALARFRQERQILANLEHPNIAHLIDGGETSTGQPYIVLEYVEGEPISQYCTRNNLAIEAKLRLFLKVCEAVEYAHRNLVVHRDLKPGNILVTADGTPKLLDFGIAKLLDPAAERTATMFQALTPQYASPEQVQGGVISTATDVYALGVILYELLTGRQPYVLSNPSPSEFQRIVCETEPAAPGLKNELDYVIRKAMRKEPERRYSSVEQFSQDIRRYLEHYPVAARPDSLWYRTGKYVRRHRLAIAAALMLAVGLTAGLIAERRQARIAHERFELVRGLANRFVFDVYDSLLEVPSAIDARRKVIETAKEYLDRLSRGAGEDPAFLAELSAAYERLAKVQGNMTGASHLENDAAEINYDKSLELIRRAARIDPQNREKLLNSLLSVSEFQRNRKSLARAEALADEGVALGKQVANEANSSSDALQNVLRAYLNAGRVFEDAGAASKVHDSLEPALTIAQRLDAAKSTARSKFMIGLVLSDLSDYYDAAGDIDRALALMSSALDYSVLSRQMDAANRTYIRNEARLRGEVAHLSFDVESPSVHRLDRSLQSWEESLQLWEKFAQADPQDKVTQVNLAINLTEAAITLMQQSPERAEVRARRGVAIFDGLRASSPRFDQNWGGPWARARTRLAWILIRTGKAAEARRITGETLPVLHEVYKATPDQLISMRALSWGLQVSARVWSALGDVARAEADYREAVRVLAPGLARQPAQSNYWSCTALAHDAAIELYQRAGNRAKAREVAEQLVTLWNSWPGSTTWVETERRSARERLAALSR